MLGTELWQPEDSVYFFDRNPHGFHFVLDYLSKCSLRLSNLDESELKILTSHLDAFCVSYYIDKENDGTYFAVLGPPYGVFFTMWPWRDFFGFSSSYRSRI